MDISVIVTSFNESDYISTAIESVLAQSQSPNEIVIVDAGSTDGTQAIISEYEKYECVNVYFIDNTYNIPEMRNFALQQAQGPLVTFLDGDDRFVPEKLEKEHDMYCSCPRADIVFSNVKNIDEDGNSLVTWFDECDPPSGDILVENASRDWPMGSLYRNELVSLDTLHKAGLYDENLNLYEDWDMKIRTAADTQAAYCPGVLTEYRQHRSGISNRTPISELRDASEYIYQKNLPLLERKLSRQQLVKVTQSMESFILELSIRAAKEDRNIAQFLFEYYKWLKITHENKFRLRKQASFIVPNILKEMRR
ncbi:glycosyltransferase family 2 protein [Salinarchaeum chitinilyticum]